jgi:hypothetical protein
MSFLYSAKTGPGNSKNARVINIWNIGENRMIIIPDGCMYLETFAQPLGRILLRGAIFFKMTSDASIKSM